MNARRSNRFLVWAIALSLAAHAVLLFFAQDMTFSDASPAPTPVPSIRIDEFTPPTPPAPTPTPQPTLVAHKPASRPRHVAVIPPALPPTIDNPGPLAEPPASPGDIGPPGPDIPPATDAPIATIPPPSCSDPNQDARAINPIDPEVPEAAQEEGLSGTTLVKVDLDATGSVTGVSVYQSSGSSLLDGAALGAARQTNYRPQLQDCEPVAGSYIFSANFTP